MIAIEDITVFSKNVSNNEESDRGNNAIKNNIRESIFEFVCKGIPTEYSEHPVYGDLWKCQEPVIQIIRSYCDLPFIEFNVKRIGGKKNHDFNCSYMNENNEMVKELFLEFKFGETRIDKLPEFYQKETNWDIFDKKYHEYWYDNYYNRLCDIYPEQVKIIDREKYLKAVLKQELKESDECYQPIMTLKTNIYRGTKTADKNAIEIRNESINEYLMNYASQIRLDIFEKMLEKQKNKLYILYDSKTNKYHSDYIDTNISNLKYSHIKNQNTIVLVSDKYEFHLLLRWKNGQCVLKPAWQVSLHQSSK